MKKVTIVGVGALGSHVALLLRNVAELKVIDFDRVEQKNVLSQLHGKMHVGKLKAQALQQTMQFLFGTKLEVVTSKLASDNAEQLLSGADLLVDCLDNATARMVVQDYARKHLIPCLHGALAANGEFGRAIWDEQFKIDGETAGAATCEDGEHLPFIATVASHLALAAKLFLVSGKRHGYQISPLSLIAV